MAPESVYIPKICSKEVKVLIVKQKRKCRDCALMKKYHLELSEVFFLRVKQGEFVCLKSVEDSVETENRHI